VVFGDLWTDDTHVLALKTRNNILARARQAARKKRSKKHLVLLRPQRFNSRSILKVTVVSTTTSTVDWGEQAAMHEEITYPLTRPRHGVVDWSDIITISQHTAAGRDHAGTPVSLRN
jgi:hypothetical protein